MDENDQLDHLWDQGEVGFPIGQEDEFFDVFVGLSDESGDEFYTDDEDDLGPFHCNDNYWRFVDGKRLFLNLKDAVVAENAVFTELECPERRQGWHYEAVLFLLEELETFFRAWKRRTTHSFTAHLKSDPEEGTTGSDTDEERPQSSQEANSVLTKRKFCESTRIFNSIFPKYELFYEIYREVQGIKKRILDIRFALFLSSVPPDIVRKLPDELWLKIWRFSAHPMDTLSLPFQPYFQESTALVEKNRLNELFLSVLRLHKILFKILFTFVLLKEPLQEMEDLYGAPQKIVESLFWCHLDDVKRALSRLNDLDSNSKREASKDLKTRIKEGVFAMESVSLHGEFCEDVEQVAIGESFFMPESQSPVWNVSHVFFPNQAFNGTFLFLQKYLSGHSVYIRFLVWNAWTNSLNAIIYTGILLVDYVSCLEYGYNLISFVGDKILFTIPDLFLNELSFVSYKWSLAHSSKELPPDPSPIKNTHKINSISFKYMPNTVSQGIASLRGEQILMLMYSVEDGSSELHGYDESGSIVISETFPPKSFIKDIKGDKVILMCRGHDTGNIIQLYCLSGRKILYTYATHVASDKYRSSVLAMFDHHPHSHKLLIFLQNKRYYLVMDYSVNEHPILVREGCISSEVEECLDESLVFHDDLLFFIEKSTTLQDRYQYHIKFFDFESTRIVTPIYLGETHPFVHHPHVETYFTEAKRIFFIGVDKLAFCKNRKSLAFLDFNADVASSIQKDLNFLKNDN